MLPIEYHVHIWQVSPQLSCGDSCLIWMWCKESNRYLSSIKKFAWGKINAQSFSNPQPRRFDFIAPIQNSAQFYLCRLAKVMFLNIIRYQHFSNSLRLVTSWSNVTVQYAFWTTGPALLHWVSLIHGLKHWGRDKMATIFQTTFSNAFSWVKMHQFWLRFHLILFPRIQLTIFQHCCQPGNKPLSEPMFVSFTDTYMRYWTSMS